MGEGGAESSGDDSSDDEVGLPMEPPWKKKGKKTQQLEDVLADCKSDDLFNQALQALAREDKLRAASEEQRSLYSEDKPRLLRALDLLRRTLAELACARHFDCIGVQFSQTLENAARNALAQSATELVNCVRELLNQERDKVEQLQQKEQELKGKLVASQKQYLLELTALRQKCSGESREEALTAYGEDLTLFFEPLNYLDQDTKELVEELVQEKLALILSATSGEQGAAARKIGAGPGGGGAERTGAKKGLTAVKSLARLKGKTAPDKSANLSAEPDTSLGPDAASEARIKELEKEVSELKGIVSEYRDGGNRNISSPGGQARGQKPPRHTMHGGGQRALMQGDQDDDSPTNQEMNSALPGNVIGGNASSQKGAGKPQQSRATVAAGSQHTRVGHGGVNENVGGLQRASQLDGSEDFQSSNFDNGQHIRHGAQGATLPQLSHLSGGDDKAENAKLNKENLRLQTELYRAKQALANAGISDPNSETARGSVRGSIDGGSCKRCKKYEYEVEELKEALEEVRTRLSDAMKQLHGKKGVQQAMESVGLGKTMVEDTSWKKKGVYGRLFHEAVERKENKEKMIQEHDKKVETQFLRKDWELRKSLAVADTEKSTIEMIAHHGAVAKLTAAERKALEKIAGRCFQLGDDDQKEIAKLIERSAEVSEHKPHKPKPWKGGGPAGAGLDNRVSAMPGAAIPPNIAASKDKNSKADKKLPPFLGGIAKPKNPKGDAMGESPRPLEQKPQQHHQAQQYRQHQQKHAGANAADKTGQKQQSHHHASFSKRGSAEGDTSPTSKRAGAAGPRRDVEDDTSPTSKQAGTPGSKRDVAHASNHVHASPTSKRAGEHASKREASHISNGAGSNPSGAPRSGTGGISFSDADPEESSMTSERNSPPGVSNNRDRKDRHSMSKRQHVEGQNDSWSDDASNQDKRNPAGHASGPRFRSMRFSEGGTIHGSLSGLPADVTHHQHHDPSSLEDGSMHRWSEDEEDDDWYGTDDDDSDDGYRGSPQPQVTQAQIRALMKLAEFCPDLSDEERKIFEKIGQRHAPEAPPLKEPRKSAVLEITHPGGIPSFAMSTEHFLQHQNLLSQGHQTHAGNFIKDRGENFSKVRIEGTDGRCRGGLPRGTAMRMGSICKGMRESISLPDISLQGEGGGSPLGGPAFTSPPGKWSQTHHPVSRKTMH